MEEKKHTEAGEEATTSRQYQRQISENQVKENVQKQLDELLVIQSIFDESILTIDSENRCGRFVAYPNIPESPFYITFSKSDKRKISESNETMDGINDLQKIEIKYLPRIEFTFALDNFYPNEDPPAFLISCQWLSSNDLCRICEHLDVLYNECRSEILYSWFTFLRDDVLKFLNLERELDVSQLLYNCTTSPETLVNQSKNYIPGKCRGNDKFDNRVVLNESMPNILRILRGRVMQQFSFNHFFFLIFRFRFTAEFDEFKREELFANEWHSCNICFSRKQGRDCVVFNCNHTNCIDCVKEYLRMQIMEGTVGSLKCPQHKCNAMVTPAMVQKIVGDELFRRYDELLLASALNTMNDIVSVNALDVTVSCKQATHLGFICHRFIVPENHVKVLSYRKLMTWQSVQHAILHFVNFVTTRTMASHRVACSKTMTRKRSY